MVNPLEGFENTINLNTFNNKINLGYENINKLDNFLMSSNGIKQSPEMLEGIITKIQNGEEINLSGLSHENRELTEDLKVLFDKAGQKENDLASFNGVHGTSEVADKFSDLLGKYLNNVDKTSKKAEHAVETFATGGNIDLHSVMIASQKASLSMQLALQMRNKIVMAYKEIQRIHV